MTRIARTRGARCVVLSAAMWLLVPGLAFAQSARDRYQAAVERDADVRTAIEQALATAPSPDLLARARKVITSFESIVRRYPASGYADNALWQAASLADEAYRKFSRPEDLDRAVRLYRWLVQEYPASSLGKRAKAQLLSLTQPRMAEPAGSDRATLTGIQRTVLSDTVRVTLELDREVSYREERLAGPARVFFDLKGVQLTPALMDKVLSYPGDVVHKIRVGRHPDNTVRVVLDLEDVSRYSVFTLYNPFRLVIDAERAVARTVATPTVVAPVSIEPLLPLAATVSAVTAPHKREPYESPRAPALAPATIATSAVMVAAAPRTPRPVAPLSPVAPATNAVGGFSIARQLGLGVSRIVIDPGHGGHDPGVLGKGLSESALVLDIALRLETLLLKEPGVEVVLTRRTDIYVPLEERTEIANRQNADLFLSIHANSGQNNAAKGIETYVLSFASSPEAEAVAARENSASAREMHQLPDMIKAIALNNKLDESRDLANMVQEALVTNLRKTNKEVRSRGVKKAPFVVLIGAAMPSVLAEISFVTNKQELQLLKTAHYKQKIAESLQAAVLRYRRSLKGTAAVAMQER